MKTEAIAIRRREWGPLLNLLMLCRQRRPHRVRTRQELTLPQGCVSAMRYSSR